MQQKPNQNRKKESQGGRARAGLKSKRRLAMQLGLLSCGQGNLADPTWIGGHTPKGTYCSARAVHLAMWCVECSVSSVSGSLDYLDRRAGRSC